ncbi:Filament-like plant protein (Fragment) [Linum perenne]
MTMEKRKWLWKKKPSERNNGESESSGSISSHSERFSDDQEALKASPNNDSQSPEVTSKTSAVDEEVNETIKCLTEKLSAALVNVSQKDDLVKQHSKVAEEAVAGWEKAENELVVVKVQLEAATQKKSQLEDRVSHLDGALKECVRQLRQARDDQEAKIHEAVASKNKEWESIKSELEKQIFQLKTEAEATKPESPLRVDPDMYNKLEYLEQENESLRNELLSQSEELEVRLIERDLSTQAAEMASRQHLESIKKLAKLEAECRRLKAVACRSSASFYDHIKTSAASSVYLESLTDSHSDSGERLNAFDLDTRKASNFDTSALVTELDRFKDGKIGNRNLPASAVEIDLMDDFLEMERLASMAETESRSNHVESGAVVKQSTDAERSLRVELETAIHHTAELESKVNELQEAKHELECSLENMKSEKAEVDSSLERMIEEKAQVERRLQEMMAEKSQMESSLTRSRDENKATESLLREVQLKLEEVETELSLARESKQDIESQLIGLEAECRTMSAQVATLETELQKEKATSAEFSIKYLYLEEELSRKKEEFEHKQSMREPKIKQEDIALAAGKLAECQKTILSLGKQLKSLATLEDFLMDTNSIPEASSSSAAARVSDGEELWRLHSNQTYSPAIDSSSSRVAEAGSHPSPSKHDHQSPPSSSSSSSSAVVSSMHHSSSDKNRNGFAKFFSRSKNGIQLEL